MYKSIECSLNTVPSSRGPSLPWVTGVDCSVLLSSSTTSSTLTDPLERH